MPDVKIRGGETFFSASLGEIDATVRAGIRSEIADQYHAHLTEEQQERARYRAVKDLRRNVQVITAASTYSTLTDAVTPEAGYKWIIRLISVTLASAGTGQAYITSVSGASPVLTMPTQSRLTATFLTSGTSQVATFGKGALILNEAEGLFFNMTQNVTGYMLSGIMTPGELVGRLL